MLNFNLGVFILTVSMYNCHTYSGPPHNLPVLTYFGWQPRAIRLDVTDQIRDCDVGKDVDIDMDVIGRIDLKDLLFPVCDDAGDISVNFGCVELGADIVNRVVNRDGCFR